MTYLITEIAVLLAIAALLFFVLGFWFGKGQPKNADHVQQGSPSGRATKGRTKGAAKGAPVLDLDPRSSSKDKEGDQALLDEVKTLRKQLANSTTRIGDLEDELGRPRSADDGKKSGGVKDGAGDSSKSQVSGGSTKKEAEKDDLTQIRGIGKAAAKQLYAAGIQRYEQIANWNAEEVAELSKKLSLQDRIKRDKWQEQAKELLG